MLSNNPQKCIKLHAPTTFPATQGDAARAAASADTAPSPPPPAPAALGCLTTQQQLHLFPALSLPSPAWNSLFWPQLQPGFGLTNSSPSCDSCAPSPARLGSFPSPGSQGQAAALGQLHLPAAGTGGRRIKGESHKAATNS